LIRAELVCGVQPPLRKTKISVAPIFLKSQVVLDYGGPQIGIVADAISVHERVDERQRQDKYEGQNE